MVRPVSFTCQMPNKSMSLRDSALNNVSHAKHGKGNVQKLHVIESWSLSIGLIKSWQA